MLRHSIIGNYYKEVRARLLVESLFQYFGNFLNNCCIKWASHLITRITLGILDISAVKYFFHFAHLPYTCACIFGGSAISKALYLLRHCPFILLSTRTTNYYVLLIYTLTGVRRGRCRSIKHHWIRFTSRLPDFSQKRPKPGQRKWSQLFRLFLQGYALTFYGVHECPNTLPCLTRITTSTLCFFSSNTLTPYVR